MSRCFSATTMLTYGPEIRQIRGEFSNLCVDAEGIRKEISDLEKLLCVEDKTHNRKGNRRGRKTMNAKTTKEVVWDIMQARGIPMRADEVLRHAHARGWISKSVSPAGCIATALHMLRWEGKLANTSWGVFAIPVARTIRRAARRSR